MTPLLLDARHQVASAAGALARATAQVARALAWSAIPAHSAAFVSDLETCLGAVRQAEAELIEARARVRLAQDIEQRGDHG